MYFNEERNSTNIDSEFVNKKQFNFKFYKKSLIFWGIILLIVLGLGIYILLPKEPPIEYYLVLNESKDVIIYQDMEYIDAGYQAYDNKGNKYDRDVVVQGDVNTAVVGEYKIKYSFNQLEEIRTVTVLAKSQQLTFLILHGDKTIYLKQGEQYKEPGYNVIDSMNSDLVNQVKVEGEVNVDQIGTYKLIYKVTNQLGVEFKEERTVIVLGTDVSISYSPENNTRDNVSINIGVVDNYFDYIIFPDGSKRYQRYDKYEVSKNGIYKFLIYSKDGSYQEKEIEIRNIDTVAPTGSCSGYYKGGNSYLAVTATDNVSSVNKIVFNGQTFQKNIFTISGEYSTVVLTIYDEVGNSNNISCQLTNKNETPKPSSNNQDIINLGNVVMCNDNKIYYGTKYTLTQSQKEKLAAMVYHEGGYNYIGMKAVASHMANLYEMNKFNHPSINESLYEFIHDNKWYAWNTRKAEYDGSSYMKQALQAVEEVIVGGKRILPLYIDEFDWFPGDVINAKDKSQYVQGKTIYINKYSDTEMVFWCFNLNSKGTSGNIFGYIKGNTSFQEYVKNK